MNCISGDERNRTKMLKYITRRSAMLTLLVFVPSLIITIRESLKTDIPLDSITIWLITNICYYFLELVINYNLHKNIKRDNRIKLFKLTLVVDLFRYLLAIAGMILFYG